MNKNWWTYFNILILAFFTIIYISKKNYEFLTYIIVLGLLVYVLKRTDKIFKYPSIGKWCFSLWLFLHMSAGIFYIGGTKIYEIILLNLIGEPYNILRFDQVLHFFFYFLFTFFVYAITLSIIQKKPNKKILALIVILASMGVGALNEIIEFSTVAFFGATGVGNYYNNALDLVFNLMGSILGVIVAFRISPAK